MHVCLTASQKTKAKGHHVFTECTKMGIQLSEFNDNNYLNLEENTYAPINRDKDEVGASESSFGSCISYSLQHSDTTELMTENRRGYIVHRPRRGDAGCSDLQLASPW